MKKIIVQAVLLMLPLLGMMAQSQKKHNFEVAKNLEIFNTIYKNLDMMYVDTLNAEETIGTVHHIDAQES